MCATIVPFNDGGLEFELFDQGNTPPMNSARIRTLHEDRAETLWVDTVSAASFATATASSHH